MSHEDEGDFGTQTYYHDEAVTFLDNNFTTREVADARPSLRVGTWPNTAELATGLGLALYHHPHTGNLSSGSGTGLALDDVRRATMFRRAFEEWKRGGGLGDQVSSLDLMGNALNYWPVIIRGRGGTNDCVAQVGGYILGGHDPDSLDWESNVDEDQEATFTGIRTPLSVNLCLEMGSGRCDLPAGGDFSLITGVGDHWLSGRHGPQKPEAEDMPFLERALGRINLLALHDDDIIMCVRASNVAAHAYGFRIDTAVMTLVGLEMGWAGSFRRMGNVQGQAVPFGWGLRCTVRDFAAGEYRSVTMSEGLVGNLISAQLLQGKAWHGPVRQTTSAGTANSLLYGSLEMGLFPGRGSKRGGPDTGTKPVFPEEAPTSQPAAPTASTGPSNVGIPPGPPTTKAGGSTEAAATNKDHLEREDTQ